MKLKNMILYVTIVILVIFTGCTNETKPEIGTNVNYEKMKGYPKWVVQPSYPKSIAAVGSADITDLGVNFAKKEAMASAREDLASQISIKVERLFKSYQNKIGVGSSAAIDTVTENTTNELVNLDLKGAILKNQWISEKNVLFVLMTINNDRLVQSATKAINNPNNYSDKKSQLKLKAKSSQDELKKEIKKYFSDDSSINHSPINDQTK